MTAVEAEAAVDPATRIRDAVRSASPADAVLLVRTDDVAHFLHARIDAAGPALQRLANGIPASPGAASGEIVLTAEAALAAAEAGRDVILVRRETTPDDVLGMHAARGILTARGGMASHAAVVARGWGIPAVVGVEGLHIDDGGITVDGHRLATGRIVSIDGRSGEVFAGAASLTTAAVPPELDVLLGWADRLRAGRVGVRANVDTAADAAHARALGAEGVGLCRTEHMFLADDRLPLVRRLILSDDPADDEAALAELERAQQHDFEALLTAMDGLPVTIRLLDPPLHEFLPDAEPLLVAEALGTLDAEQAAVLAAVRRLHESNPMLGTRGVRLGVVKPGLYPMQVRAIAGAVSALRARGHEPVVEVMIPLTMSARELRWARESVVAAGDGAMRIGTMIETPRAAVMAGDLAGAADFFSFGTNDLTQLTFAFSRDDVESKLLPRYLEAGLLEGNPFEVLDQAGVGFLVRHAIDAARAVKPGMSIGVCGEQAGDPDSARFLVAAGVDYVSCSPYRLPVVRLAVAQALLALGLAETDLDDEVTASAEPAVVGTAPGDGVPDDAGDAVPDDAGFRLLHALKVKGFAGPGTLVEMTGLPGPWVEAALADLLAAEAVRFLEARGFWQLTPAGKERHAALLPGADAADLDRVRNAYDAFLDLNTAFKDLCQAWQLRDGEPNDHTDAGYDTDRVADLLAHDATAGPVLDAFAAAVPRLGRYRVRLHAAAMRVESGQRDQFTGVLKDSYHDIWMELHEDLLSILGIDRNAEGSF